MNNIICSQDVDLIRYIALLIEKDNLTDALI